ncbi:MAG: DUF481 domain-containing protein [Woeseiaceae bacterium]
MRRSVCVAMVLGAVTFMPQAFAADDVVVFKNGDRLSGEVKSLGRGRLTFKTDATGTIKVEWDEVAFLQVDQHVQVEVQSGARYFGRISKQETEAQIRVETSAGPVDLENIKVIAMEPIDQSGFRDIDLSVALGFNYTKASNVSQFNVSADASYRTRIRILSAEYSSVISDSSNNDLSQRQTLAFNYTRLRSNRWLNDGGISFDRNDELGLNLRTSLSAGVGRIISQSNSSELVVKGGLKATREDSAETTGNVDSLESYGELSWEWYRYDSPELDWSTSLEVIPSLTESGRVRGEFDTTLKWEIFSDLFWQLQYYNSYDNQTQGDADSNTDYGVITSISYDF